MTKWRCAKRVVLSGALRRGKVANERKLRKKGNEREKEVAKGRKQLMGKNKEITERGGGGGGG